MESIENVRCRKRFFYDLYASRYLRVAFPSKTIGPNLCRFLERQKLNLNRIDDCVIEFWLARYFFSVSSDFFFKTSQTFGMKLLHSKIANKVYLEIQPVSVFYPGDEDLILKLATELAKPATAASLYHSVLYVANISC